MGIPYIAICVIIIVVYVNLRANRAMRRDDDIRRAFWEREREANLTRRKSLDHLPYIHIPDDIPPEDIASLSADAQDAAGRIQYLRDEDSKIVNLTGYTNTDLKLEYGAPNITALTEYDGHYTQLATALHDLGKALYEAGRYEESARVLSFAVETKTDISETYRILIDLYRTKLGYSVEEAGRKVSALQTVAQGLRSLSKNGICAMIEEALNVLYSV